MRQLLRYFLLCIPAMACFAAPAQLLPIRNYTTREGLNANGIYAILRDSKGVLWVGTYNGVNWYDGSHFFQPSMSTRSGQIYVTNFKEDSAGQVWVTSWYSGLYKFADGRFTNYLPDTLHIESQSNSTFDLLELGNSQYLVATDQNAWLFDGQKFTLFDAANTDLTRQISTLARTPGGDILVGYGHGIARYKLAGTRWVYSDMLLNTIETNKIVIAGDECWVATRNGLWYSRHIDSPAPEFIHFDGEPAENLFIDRNKNCWFTSGQGVRKLITHGANDPYPLRDPQIYTKANGLPSSIIRAIYSDDEGITWLGTEYGLAKLNENYYRFYPIQEEDHGDANIIAIGQDRDGRLWLGSYLGLFQMQGDGRTLEAGYEGSAWTAGGNRNIPDAPDVPAPGGNRGVHSGNDHHAGFVYGFIRDHRQDLWACTAKGIFRLNSGVLKMHYPIQAFSMAEDTEGNLWFGGMNGNIYRLPKEGLPGIGIGDNPPKNGIGDNLPKKGIGDNPPKNGINHDLPELYNPAYLNEKISAIYRDAKGYLWVGYALAGLKKFRVTGNNSLQLVKEYSSRNGHANLRVRSFCDDRHGHLLVGTRTDGLYIFDLAEEPATAKPAASNPAAAEPSAGNPADSTITHINTRNGLGGNWIKTAVCKDNNIFLATNNGLDILDARNYQSRPRHIAFNNDAVPTEFNTVFLQGDTVWVGTAKGALQYTPSKQQKNSRPPPVYIMKVTIDGGIDSNYQPFTAGGELPTLSWRQNNIAFDFAGLSFLDEDNVRYRYRMKGLDNEWSLVTDRRYVNYSHLSPGKYRFEVIAQNNDGVWSPTPASLDFTIATPFWLSWWFITLCLAILAGLIYALYRYRLRQALQIERLRVKISTDLHDDIGSTLSSISILSEIVLQEEGEEPRSGMVKEIKESSISLMEKMDDIVWSINPRNDELESLMLRIKRFASQLFEAKGIDYEIDIENSIRHLKLPMEHRQSIYLIMKEAINNLVKYAEARKALIKADSEGQFLKVQISDDGKGFRDEKLRSGNGIVNMKSRAEAMGATLHLDSIPGKGVTMILILKMK